MSSALLDSRFSLFHSLHCPNQPNKQTVKEEKKERPKTRGRQTLFATTFHNFPHIRVCNTFHILKTEPQREDGVNDGVYNL